MCGQKTLQLLRCVGLLILLISCCVTEALPLSLKHAEAIALAHSPEIHSLIAKSHALQQRAIAADQLSDPKLTLGAMNVPANSFNFGQEPMTQIQVGLAQQFPRGRSLHYASMTKHVLSIVERHKEQVMKLQVLKGVRLSWLNLYYWLSTQKIILKQKQVIAHLLTVTTSMLSQNKAQQKDVIRAQIELTTLNERLLEVKQKIATSRAQLGRWIGASLAKKAYPSHLLHWPLLHTLKSLLENLKHHPLLRADDAAIAAQHAQINLARQQYKPGFSVGVAYGFRQGRNINGSHRPDFLTAQVSLDLPIFPHNRQDRTLAATEEILVADEDTQMSHYKQLREALKTQYALWQAQRKSTVLYYSHLIPEAKLYVRATKNAYQNAQTDFPTLARAYVLALNSTLAGLKAAVSRDKARVNLLYLQGH